MDFVFVAGFAALGLVLAVGSALYCAYFCGRMVQWWMDGQRPETDPRR